MTVIKKTVTGFGEAGKKLGPSYAAGGNGKWRSPFGKQFGSFSKNETELPYYPTIPLQDI